MMKYLRRLSAVLAILAAVVVPVAPAGAADVLSPACQANADSTLCKENQDENINSNRIFGPDGVFTAAARIIAMVVGIASVMMIIIAGIQYSVSSGDPSKINNAKDTLLYALIGLAITLMAQAIIVFVLGRI